MRLTLLTPTLDQSGAEKQLTQLAAGLRKTTDWDLEVVALTRGGPYEDILRQSDIPLTILEKRFRFDPICLGRLKKHLKQRSPDLLHTWMFTANSYGRIAVGKYPQYPIIVSERCVDIWKAGWQKKVDRWLLPRTSALIANSTPVGEFYHNLGYPRELINVIPNGVDIPDCRNTELRQKFRKEWNIPEHAKVVGYVGRLAPQKRVKDLLWAFQLLQQLSNQTYFVIAGDGPERNYLEDLAIRYTCEHLVRFVGHQPQGSDLMHAFDLFWLGSEFEGMSNSLMEAMAAGVPAVASDIPANRELILPEITGDLFPLGNRTALAQMSDRILNEPEVYQAMSHASRDRMQNKFRVDQMVQRHFQLYEAVLNRHHTARTERGA